MPVASKKITRLPSWKAKSNIEYTPPWYTLALIKGSAALKKGKIYVGKSNNLLEYIIVDNDDDKKIIHAKISQDELKDEIPEPFNLVTLAPLLPKILEITSKRGHTKSKRHFCFCIDKKITREKFKCKLKINELTPQFKNFFEEWVKEYRFNHKLKKGKIDKELLIDDRSRKALEESKNFMEYIKENPLKKANFARFEKEWIKEIEEELSSVKEANFIPPTIGETKTNLKDLIESLLDIDKKIQIFSKKLQKYPHTVNRIKEIFQRVTETSFLNEWEKIKYAFEFFQNNTIIATEEAKVRQYVLNLREFKNLKEARKFISDWFISPDLREKCLLFYVNKIWHFAGMNLKGQYISSLSLTSNEVGDSLPPLLQIELNDINNIGQIDKNKKRRLLNIIKNHFNRINIKDSKNINPPIAEMRLEAARKLANMMSILLKIPPKATTSPTGSNSYFECLLAFFINEAEGSCPSEDTVHKVAKKAISDIKFNR